jgi:hypothetical protein
MRRRIVVLCSKAWSGCRLERIGRRSCSGICAGLGRLVWRRSDEPSDLPGAIFAHCLEFNSTYAAPVSRVHLGKCQFEVENYFSSYIAPMPRAAAQESCAADEWPMPSHDRSHRMAEAVAWNS